MASTIFLMEKARRYADVVVQMEANISGSMKAPVTRAGITEAHYWAEKLIAASIELRDVLTYVVAASEPPTSEGLPAKKAGAK